MPHTQSTLFADMLSLLKELEWSGSPCTAVPFCHCVVCGGPWSEVFEEGEHRPGCHLQSTIALAEEHIRNA